MEHDAQERDSARQHGLRWGGDPELVALVKRAFALGHADCGDTRLAVYCARRRVDRGALEFAREHYSAGRPALFAAVEWGVAFVGPRVEPGSPAACLECVARRLGDPDDAQPEPPAAELTPVPALAAALLALEFRRFRARGPGTLAGAQLVLNPQPDVARGWERVVFRPDPDFPTCGSGRRPAELRPSGGRISNRPARRSAS